MEYRLLLFQISERKLKRPDGCWCARGASELDLRVASGMPAVVLGICRASVSSGRAFWSFILAHTFRSSYIRPCCHSLKTPFLCHRSAQSLTQGPRLAWQECSTVVTCKQELWSKLDVLSQAGVR